MTTAKEALDRLKNGNQRFVNDELTEESHASRRHSPSQAAPQEPFAIVLACSDSRVPTEVIFDCGIGELFIIRVAGNIATPSQIGSIEYAASQLGTPLVVVLGHSNCGAVAATLAEMNGGDRLDSPNLRSILDAVRPALVPVLKDHPGATDAEVIGPCIRANVRAVADELPRNSKILSDRIEQGELTIVGAEYSIETGRVEFLD